MLLMIKSLFKPPKPSKPAKLESNAQPSPLMKLVWQSLISSRCGGLQTVQSETSSEVPFSEPPSLSRTSQNLFQDGRSQLSLEDTPLEISTKPQISAPGKLENSQWLSLLKIQARNQPISNFSISHKMEVSWWECTILMTRSKSLLTHACHMLSAKTCPATWQPRTQFSRNTMVASRISSRKSTTEITENNLRQRVSGMSIALLMIWLRMSSNLAVASFGPVRTTTVMFNPISLPKVMDPSVSWPPSSVDQMSLEISAKLKLPTELSLDIIAFTRRVERPPPIQSPQCSPGPAVFSTWQSFNHSLNSRLSVRL